LFGPSIPTCDDAAEALADNRILGRLDYCGEDLNCQVVILKCVETGFQIGLSFTVTQI
jgi:hypothetical protein